MTDAPSRALKLAVLVLAILWLPSCSIGKDEPELPSPSPSSSTSTPEPTPEQSPEPTHPPTASAEDLLYLEGTDLYGLDLTSGNRTLLARFPTQDVFAYGDLFAVVENKGGGDDFAERPVLALRDGSGRKVRSLGVGFGPLVSSDGYLAYLRPGKARECEGETCSGGLEVMVIMTPEERPKRLLDAGHWNLLAWAGENLLVADQTSPDEALLVDPNGEVRPLPYAPNEIWDGTHDDVIVVSSGVAALDIESHEVVSLPVDGLLADGVVTGSTAYAVELKGAGSRMIVIDVAARSVERVPSSKGAMGPVLASPSDRSFAYVRADGLQLEAVFCKAPGTCAPVLRWSEGITPLALR